MREIPDHANLERNEVKWMLQPEPRSPGTYERGPGHMDAIGTRPFLEESGVNSDKTTNGNCATGSDTQLNQRQSDWNGDLTSQGAARILQSGTLERLERESEPITWREHPVRSVINANYKKNTTDSTGMIGRRRNAREEMPSMMHLVLTILHSLEYLRAHCGHSGQNADNAPGALASGHLEFLGCSNAPDVGATRDAGNGETVHGHPNDGDQ